MFIILDHAIKQQLHSLYYVRRLLLAKRKSLQHGRGGSAVEKNDPREKERAAHYDLPLGYILNNHVALSYFIGIYALMFFFAFNDKNYQREKRGGEEGKSNDIEVQSFEK